MEFIICMNFRCLSFLDDFNTSMFVFACGACVAFASVMNCSSMRSCGGSHSLDVTSPILSSASNGQSKSGPMDSKDIKMTMWQEIVHYVKCSKPGSFLNTNTVSRFLGIKGKMRQYGWKQIDRFLATNDLDPSLHFCQDITSRGKSRYRYGITLEAFVVLLFGGAQLRDNDLHTPERKETEENIKWLKQHLLSLLTHSILIASQGISLGDDSRFLHFDKEKHLKIRQEECTSNDVNITTANPSSDGTPQHHGIKTEFNGSDIVTNTSNDSECRASSTKSLQSGDDVNITTANLTTDGTPQHHGIKTEFNGSNEVTNTLDDSECRASSTKSVQNSDDETLQNSKSQLKEEATVIPVHEGRSKIQTNMTITQEQTVPVNHDEPVSHDESAPLSGDSVGSFVKNGTSCQHERTSLKSINRKYRCKFCQRRFQRNRLGFRTFRRHLENHEKRYSVCRYRSTRGPSSIYREIKTVSEIEKATTYKCSFCHDEFSTKGSWKQHMENHNRSQSHQCEVKECEMFFQTKISLVQHAKKQHKKHLCYICLMEIGGNRYASKKHFRLFHARKSCPYCAEEFTSIRNYRKHVVKHERQCRFCDKVFLLRTAREEHEMVVHFNKEKYKCDFCSKEFVHSIDFNKHKNGALCIPSRKCGVCSKVFKPGQLASHMKYVHNGVPRPKRCRYCSKTFTNKRVLETHYNTHTEDEKRQLCTCKVCGKSFKGKTRLYKHIRIVHKGEQFCCEFCGKICSEKWNMDVHVRCMHTGERPYKCSDCGKGFINASNLKQHLYTHTGGKPFQCDNCKTHFRSGKNLKAHEEAAHSSDFVDVCITR